MKIGLIVFSQTGNTLKVAQALASSLRDGGHEAQLLRVSVATADPKDASKPVLLDKPDPGAFDMVYFAAPVQGFSLAPAMLAYLTQMPALGGKRVAYFVTQFFPFRWMGGNRALRQFKAALEAKGAALTQSGVVNWSRKDRDRRVAGLLREMTAASPVNL
jgi:flavodoxin